METAALPRTSAWTLAQKGVLVLTIAYLAWAAAGLIVNPDFSTGADAPVEKVLGVDFNGWHAVSGFLLFAPGFVAMTRADWALLYAVATGVVLWITAGLILLDDTPLFLLTLPDQNNDAIFHFATGATYLMVAVAQLRRDRL